MASELQREEEAWVKKQQVRLDEISDSKRANKKEKKGLLDSDSDGGLYDMQLPWEILRADLPPVLTEVRIIRTGQRGELLGITVDHVNERKERYEACARRIHGCLYWGYGMGREESDACLKEHMRDPKCPVRHSRRSVSRDDQRNATFENGVDVGNNGKPKTGFIVRLHRHANSAKIIQRTAEIVIREFEKAAERRACYPKRWLYGQLTVENVESNEDNAYAALDSMFCDESVFRMVQHLYGRNANSGFFGKLTAKERNNLFARPSRCGASD